MEQRQLYAEGIPTTFFLCYGIGATAMAAPHAWYWAGLGAGAICLLVLCAAAHPLFYANLLPLAASVMTLVARAPEAVWWPGLPRLLAVVSTIVVVATLGLAAWQMYTARLVRKDAPGIGVLRCPLVLLAAGMAAAVSQTLHIALLPVTVWLIGSSVKAVHRALRDPHEPQAALLWLGCLLAGVFGVVDWLSRHGV